MRQTEHRLDDFCVKCKINDNKQRFGLNYHTQKCFGSFNKRHNQTQGHILFMIHDIKELPCWAADNTKTKTCQKSA